MEQNSLGAEDVSYQDINILTEITDKKLLHLKSFFNITVQQKEAIDADDIDKLNMYIDKKQMEIDVIDKLDTLFAESFQKLKLKNNIADMNELSDDAYPYIKELKQKVTEVNEILRKIQLIDNQNTDIINQKFNEVKFKLRQVKQGQKLNKGYNIASYGTMFIDQKK